MRKLLFLILINGLFSCSSNEVVVPSDVLKEREMTSILTDIHMAQSMIGNRSKEDSINYSVNDYLPVILKNHHTEKKTFLRSLKFYSENPEMLKMVYDSVITGLNRIQGELEK